LWHEYKAGSSFKVKRMSKKRWETLYQNPKALKHMGFASKIDKKAKLGLHICWYSANKKTVIPSSNLKD